MPVRSTRRATRAVAALIFLWMLLSSVYPPLPARAQAEPAATTTDTLVFEQVVTMGQDGFTEVSSPDGIDGRTIFRGTRNGENTIWVLENGTYTAVLPGSGILPDGLGMALAFGTPRMLPNGDVLFRANVDGGSLSAGSYVFRWRSGTLIVAAPTGENFTHVVHKPNRGFPISDGRWLAFEVTGDFPRQSHHYYLTDGETVTPLVTLTDTAVDGVGSGGFVGWCTRTERRLHAVNAAGVYAFSERTFQNDPCFFPNIQRLSEWSIKLGGAVGATLISGSYTNPPGVGIKGVEPRFDDPILSDANEFVFVRLTLDPTVTPKVSFGEVIAVAPGGAQRVLFPAPGPNGTTMSGGVTYLDAQGRFAGLGILSTSARLILKGNVFANDVLIKDGDPLFGSTLLFFQPDISVYQVPGMTGENRGFLFQYELADGTKGIGRAAPPKPRWANAAGGAWGTSGSWTPAAVPAQNAQVTFGPPATYTAAVGTRTIGSVVVEQGNVRFVDAELEVSTAGSLAVVGSPNGPVPSLTIGQGRAGAGTQEFESAVAANVSVGPGELQMTNAGVVARPTAEFAGFAELGTLGPATATVTGGSQWSVQTLTVGSTAPALLRVEDGGWIRPLSGELLVDELWIGGFADSIGIANQASAVRVDGASGNAGPHGLGASIGPVERLVVGQRQPGTLDVVNGSSVLVVTATVGTRDHGTLVDGTLTVDGANTAQPSRLEAGRDVLNDGGLFVATATGTRAEVNIFNGGQVTATQLLLAAGPQSSALMFVDGLEPADVVDQSTMRSALYAPFPPPVGLPQESNPAAGICVIGYRGQGTLNVSNGGLVQCHQVVVGFAPGSRGELNISGAFRSILPTVAAVGSASFEDALVTGRGVVCVGRVARCGSTVGTVRGDVALGPDGVLEAVIVAVGPGGRILGNGVVIASGAVSVNGGTVAPGVFVSEGAAAAKTDRMEESEVALAPSAGTLTIEGHLMLSSTSVISLEVLGPAAAQQDRIVVSGTATLAGTLLVQFANGYVPAEGDQFAFIQAGSTSGSFGTVTVTGLPSGFKIGVGSANGVVTLTVTDDGDPSTPGDAAKTYLPMVSK